MSLELKKKQVLESFYCVSIPYCDMQHLLCKTIKTGYTCGVYGWNSDVYVVGNWAIVTGYNPFQNIKIDDDLKRQIIKKYDEKWKNISSNEINKLSVYDDMLNFISDIRRNMKR